MFLNFKFQQSIIFPFYSTFFHKSISENRLQLSVKEKKVKAKIRRGKVENFTLNSYILCNFKSNIYNIIDFGHQKCFKTILKENLNFPQIFRFRVPNKY